MVVCIPATTSGRKRVFFNHKWSNKDRFRPQVVKIGSNSTTSGQPKNATKSGKSKPHKDHIGFSNYGSVWGVLRPCFLGQLPHRIVLGLYAGSKSSHQTSAWRVLGPTASVPGAARGRAIGLVGRWVRGLQLLDFWMLSPWSYRGAKRLPGESVAPSTGWGAKVVKFMKLSSQTIGSGGTEWSVPVSRSCRKSLDS